VAEVIQSVQLGLLGLVHAASAGRPQPYSGSRAATT